MASSGWLNATILLLLLLISGYTEAQNCAEVDLIDGLGSSAEPLMDGLVADYIVEVDPAEFPEVQIMDSQIVCLATNVTRGQYRYASAVVMYSCTGDSCPAGGNLVNDTGGGADSGNVTGNVTGDSNTTTTAILVSQFDFRCVDGSWSIDLGNGNSAFQTPPATASLSTATRMDCASCTPDAMDDDETHCNSCSPMCSDLDECTGENSSDCCNNIDNGMCVLDCQPPRDYITDDSVCVEPPNPTVTPSEIVTDLGGNFILNCTVSVRTDESSLSWVKVAEENVGRIDSTLTCTSGSSGQANTTSQAILEDSPRVTLGGILELSSISPDDSGYYVCIFRAMNITSCFSEIVSVTVPPDASIDGNQSYSFEETAQFQCSVLGGPVNSFQWSKDGQTLENEVSMTLTVTNINSSSGGMYTCRVNNSAGMDTASTNLTVQPYFITQPENTGGINGSVIDLTCEADAFPSPTYRWEQVGGTIRSDVRGVDTDTLTFDQLQFEDQGDYVCNAISDGISIPSDSATLSVAPLVTDISMQQTYRREANVTLSCSAVGGPDLFFLWLFNGMAISGENSSILSLSEVNASDGGMYTCVAFNSAGNDTANTMVYISPYFITAPQDLNGSNGTVQSLTCEAEAFPTPEYQWVKSGDMIRSEVLGVTASTLQFNPLMFGDDGSYYCNATSQGISIQSNTVILTVAPLVSMISDSQTYGRGDDVTLNCSSLGGPRVSFQWQFEGLDIDGENSDTLLLNNVNASHGGEYTCVVSNRAGNDSDIVSVFISPYFVTQPQDTSGLNGSSLSLTCEAESFPAPAYEWTRQDGQIIRDQVMEVDSTILSFNPLLFGDEGSYFCNVTSQGISIQSALSVLTVAPLVAEISGDQTYSRGDNATLSCSALGGPEVYFQWQFNRLDLSDETNSTLNITNVDASLGGVYTCVVSNSAGNDSDSSSVFIAPYFVTFPEDVDGVAGSSQSLVCVAEAFPNPMYQWTKLVGSIRAGVNGTTSERLMFGSLVVGDEGSYYCNATSRMLTIQSNITTVTISPVGSLMATPTINSSVNATELLKCTAMGGPGNMFEWRRMSMSLGFTEQINVTIVSAASGGDYQCVVSNRAGNDTIVTIVNVAPTITGRSDATSVSTGGNTTISCTAEGFPAPNVTWYHNGTEIIDPVTTSTNDVVVSSSVLVSLAMANDSGQYTCNFTSPVSVYSVVTATIQVFVQGVPERPINLRETNTTSTSTVVTWEEPHSNNAPIQYYLVQYTEPDFTEGDRNRALNVTDVRAAITDLSPGVNYMFTVTALNEIGSSAPSDPLLVRTLDEVPSSAPRNVSAIAVNSTAILVSWLEVDRSNRNGNITSYDVMYMPLEDFNGALSTDPMTQQVTSSLTLRVLLTGLQEFVNYTIFVRASTSAGPGNYSDPVTTQTLEDAPASSPQNVRLNVTSPNDITVSWDEVTPFDQNGIITFYEVMYIPDQNFGDSIVSLSMNITAPTQTVRISGLQAYVNYTVSVRAYTSQGEGPYSNGERALTNQDIPSGSPDIQEALNVSSTAILVTWTEVNARDRNGIIITYEVDYQPANRFNDSDIVDIVNTTNTSIVLQNLHEFVQYNITVRAYTSIGPGPFSEHELSITQEAQPASPPANVRAQAISSTQIEVMWNPVPSIDRNGLIIAYEVEYVPVMDFGGLITADMINVAGTDLSVILTDLQEYVVYNISVRAYTMVGGGPYSDDVFERTFEDRPASPPTNVQLTVLSSTSIMAAWNEVLPIDQNGIINVYEILYEPLVDFDGRISSMNTNTTMLSANLMDLQEFVSYNISVRAYTIVGEGPYSTPQTAMTSQDLPNASPRNVMAMTTSPTTISVMWTEVDPIEQNGVIITYEVQYEPLQTFQGQINTTSVNTSDLSVNLTDLQEYVNYNITVRAYTVIGAGPYSDPVTILTLQDTPRTPPRNVMATATSPTTISVTWTEVDPIDQNGVIITYEVQYEPLQTFQGQINTNSVNTSNLSVNLTDLQEYVNYNITVRAYTVIGAGPYSDPVTILTLEDTPRTPPRNVIAMAISPTTISVMWTEVDPIDQNGVIITYEVQYEPLQTFQGQINTNSINTSNLSVNLTDLQEYVNYNITVRAYTVIGAGPYSDPITILTLEDTPRTPPRNVTAMATSPTTISVRWTEVDPIDQNGVIITYEVQYEPLQTFQGQIMTNSVNTSELSITLIDLQEYVNYNITVRAYTVIGAGPYSDPVTILTFQDTPRSPPRSVTAMTTSPTDILVTWIEVDTIDQNGVITMYEVMYIPQLDFGGAIGVLTVNETGMSVTLVNLQEDVDYSISVRAYTTVGAGPYSDPVIERTDEDAPAFPPDNVTAIPLSSTTIMVTWNIVPPIRQNGPIIIYEVMYAPMQTFDGQIMTRTTNTSALWLNLTELQEYVVYSISVRAYTIIGPGPYSSPVIDIRTFEDEPDAPPSNVLARADSSTSIMVNWTQVPAINRNGIINMYEIEYIPLQTFEGQIMTATMNVSDILSARLTGLQEYVNYSISVRAYTRIGQGAYSSAITILTLEDEPSSAPINVTVTAISSTIILVVWNEVVPINRNGEITTYQIEFTPLEDFGGRIGRDSVTMSSTSLSTNLTSLQEFVFYNISVRAYTSVGPGPYSSPEREQTMEDEPDGFPRNVTLEVVSATEIMVSWVEVNPFNRNGIITIYEVTYQPQENYDRMTTYMNTTSLLVPLTGLHEYAVYNIEVKAFTIVGPGPDSPVVSIRTNTSNPSASPQGIRSEVRSSTSIYVSWEVIPEVHRNGIITNYEVTYAIGSSPALSNRTGSGSTLSIELTNLEEDETYSIRVRGYTSAGFGPNTAPIFSRTFQDAPGPVDTPVMPTEISSTSVVLNWKTPSDPNGNITDYKVNLFILSTDRLEYKNSKTSTRRKREVTVNDAVTVACVAGNIANVDRNITTGSAITTLTLSDLTPYTVYQFKILASTAIGFGPSFSQPVTFETLESEPEAVENLNLNVTSTSIGVAWTPPTCPYGDVRKYRVFHRTVEAGKISSENYKMNEVQAAVGRQFFNITDLTFYTNYSIQVQAVVMAIAGENVLYGANISDMIRTLSGPDETPTSGPTLEVIPGPSSSRISILVPDPRSIRTGRVIFVAIVVVLGSVNDVGTDQSQYDDAGPYTNVARYYIAAAWNETAVYNGQVNSTIVVGDNMDFTVRPPGSQDKTTYSNVPLRSNQDYCIFIRYDIFNEDPGSTVPHRSYSPTTCTKTRLPYSEAGLGIGIILIIIFIAGVILAIILIYYFVFKKNKTGIFKVRKDRKQHEMMGLDENNVKAIEAAEDRGHYFHNPIADEYPSSHDSISVDDFAEHIQVLHANDNYRFTEEYSIVEPDHHPTTENTRRPENIQKNRYANITSYDHSRVYLDDTGQPGSDYINANYIDGYRAKNCFVATQGPMPGTVSDFWRMVWEQCSTTIVMLTNLEEKGRIKCFQYWPDELNNCTLYGEFKVTLQECLILATYTVRTFAIHREGSKEERIIRQFHYTVWPDHGVPDEPSSLLHFVRKVTQSNPSSSGPMAVHCSAGVGRTGTFITLHAQLLRIEKEQNIRIFEFVLEMRRRRCFMVQTELQYIFLHDALLEAIECGVTEVSARDLRDQFKHLQTVDPETRTSYIDAEFSKLSTTIHIDLPKTNACLNLNKMKNRYNDAEAIPYDKNRVRLISIPGIPNSDYINASQVDGYHHRKAFIATQGPLPDTTEDFWRMVWEQKCSTVVMLTKERESNRARCHKYWPESGARQCGYLQVIAHNQFTYADYMLRELTLVDVRDQQEMPSQTVKLYQFLDWPEEPGAVPNNGTGLIDLIGQVQKWQITSGNKPIVVHCSGGTGRTGTFIAVSILLERLKTEGVVDVFHTVRALRLQRPGMVQSVPQYKFCYKTVIEFLESFEHYSNFK